MNKFKIGQQVTIRKDSIYHHQCPPEKIGYITKIYNDDGDGDLVYRHNYRIEWSNSGYRNSYRVRDIQLMTVDNFLKNFT